MTISAVFLVPSQFLDAANKAASKINWGNNTFSVALTSDKNTVSHYACRADVTAEEKEYFESIDNVIVESSLEDWGSDHFNLVLKKFNLKKL